MAKKINSFGYINKISYFSYPFWSRSFFPAKNELSTRRSVVKMGCLDDTMLEALRGLQKIYFSDYSGIIEP